MKTEKRKLSKLLCCPLSSRDIHTLVLSISPETLLAAGTKDSYREMSASSVKIELAPVERGCQSWRPAAGDSVGNGLFSKADPGVMTPVCFGVASPATPLSSPGGFTSVVVAPLVASTSPPESTDISVPPK
eukprot:CAMPEP_0171994588 /NCGR_PEP_ID=MMETSP0993-20121228/279031_1 /TAXON_ID=483369 /ORGANISM="non described non described, Strain CCMP2098" /LENGTH=130 /DNA_ID=CAMNT_0012647667 /DNA_START=449 /DNA_END=841 /DNA_ORIENTATION=+